MDRRTKILDQTSYWVERINATLYNAILDYMETNNLKRKDLAEHFGISKSRVSQILNNGEINFSLEKLIQIALKIGMYPNFKFEPKEEFLSKKETAKSPKGIVVGYSSESLNIASDVENSYK